MKIYIKTGIILSLIFTWACTNDFEEINQNPNGPTKVPAVLLIPAQIERTQDQLYSTFAGGDMGNCWAQLWSKVQYNDEERYNPRGSVINGIWNNFYAGSLMDGKVMLEIATEEGNENLQGVAKVLMAYNFSILTDMYGDIPFTDALDAKNGTNSPAYTPQSEIYPALLEMLDEANDLLSSDGGEIDAIADILYAGDYMKWKKFANSLKFRLLMRMSAKADVSADLTVLLNRPMFESNDDEAKLIYLSSSPNANPVYASVIAGNRAEYKVSDVLVNQLVSNADPRLEMYVQLNADDEYRGKPAGISNVPNTDYNYDNVSAIGEPFLAPEAPGYLISYAELQFFMAEAAHRNLIGGNALDYYSTGITASMESVGVTSFGNYLTANALTQGKELEQIGTQKWLALFGQGVEAWTEWRRTGFPALSPALEPINITEIPSRYTYPSDEQSLNNANYSTAVAAQGEDKLTTKVWWNK